VTEEEYAALRLARKHELLLAQIDELNPLQRVIARGFIERLLNGDFAPNQKMSKIPTIWEEDWTPDY
jgi:hypothetical protein